MRCNLYTYDTSYAQFTVSAQAGVSGCPGRGSGEIQFWGHAFDTLVGKETITINPALAESIHQYDGLGRLQHVRKPNSSIPLEVDPASTTISYQDTYYGTGISITQQDVESSPAPPPYVTYQFFDGFGRIMGTFSTADPSAGDLAPWITSDFVTRDAFGNVAQQFLPDWSSAASSLNVPPTSPAATAKHTSYSYDTFGRLTQSQDIDGTVTASVLYHGLLTDYRDAEEVSGTHLQAHATRKRDGHGRITDRTDYSSTGTIDTHLGYLPTGEVKSISRTGNDAYGPVNYSRSAVYDTLGRMLANVEPNTSGGAGIGWRYAYNDLGDMVGTSDARGCGQNIAYDGLGRVISRDYSPCTADQQPYGMPPTADGTNTEAFFVYETLGGYDTGLVQDVYGRGAHMRAGYDARGRVTSLQKEVAYPGNPRPSLTARYTPSSYTTTFEYDDFDRPTGQTTGATVAELQGPYASVNAQIGASTVLGSYSARGLLRSASGGYGLLYQLNAAEADGRPDSVLYGDTAATTATFSYADPRLRLSEVQIARSLGAFPGAQGSYTPPPAGTLQPTQQTVLLDDFVPPGPEVGYDNVSNPLEVNDKRLVGEWPSGAEPVATQQFAYDDSYRLTNVARTYAQPTGSSLPPGTDTWTPPLAAANMSPMPLSSAPTYRMTSQSFSYDGLGNTRSTGDDTHVFFDRSLGSIHNGGASGAPGPNQIASASLTATTGASGALATNYDAAGNMVRLGLQRGGTCTAGSPCTQIFDYDWDEVGHLARARRYDLTGSETPATYPWPSLPSHPAAADSVYAYDAGGGRVIRASKGATPHERTFTIEIFPSLRLNTTTFANGDYAASPETESVYLTLGSASFGRVVYAPASPVLQFPGPSGEQPLAATQYQHVFLELTDSLGSTSVVIDKATSELVERSTFFPYGAAESDYRPERWGSFREDYKFTGKEEDVALGIVYFGARYYSPYLGRWLSPDPLTIHSAGADPNPYAYVAGRVTTGVDALGLQASSNANGTNDNTDEGNVPNSNVTPCGYETCLVLDTNNGGPLPTTQTPTFTPPASWAGTPDSPGEYFNLVAETAEYGPVDTWAGNSALGYDWQYSDRDNGLAEAFFNGFGILDWVKGFLGPFWNPVADVSEWTIQPVDPMFELPRVDVPDTSGAAIGGGASILIQIASGDEEEVLAGFWADGENVIARAPEGRTLFHYTDEAGHTGILDSEALNPSLKALNPKDARYGNGQYLSDIVPGTKTPAQLSREFLGIPFQGSRFTHYVEIDVSGLNVVEGRAGVFVIPNEGPLDLGGRIVGSGLVPLP